MLKKSSLYISIFSLLFFSACSHSHTHTFYEEWTFDETNHWHKASCEHTEEIDGLEEHIFDEYVYNNDATTETDGTKTRTCTICGYKDTITAEGTKLHKHTFSNEWCSDSIKHWHKATCEHTDLISDFENHTWADEIILSYPTCTTKGKKRLICGICNYILEADIPATGHSFSKDFEKDPSYHWHKATCIHKEIVSNKELHVWDSGKVTKQATCNEPGIKLFTCTVCGATKNENIPGDHKWNSGIVTLEPTCTEPGEKTVTCTACHQTDIISIPPKGHAFSTSWSHDSNRHWHAASCEHTGLEKDSGKHEFISETIKNPTEVENGIKKITCKICGYSYTDEIPKNINVTPPGEVTNIYSDSIIKKQKSITIHWTNPTDPDFDKVVINHIVEVNGFKSNIVEEIKGNPGEQQSFTFDHYNEHPSYNNYIGYIYQTCYEFIIKTYDTAENASNGLYYNTGYNGHMITPYPNKQGQKIINERTDSNGNLKINGKVINKSSEVYIVPENADLLVCVTVDPTRTFINDERISLSPFVMGQYPVTRKLFTEIMGEESIDPEYLTERSKGLPYSNDKSKLFAKTYGNKDDNPVTGVSWIDAIYFCNKLSILYGLEPVYSMNLGTEITNPDDWFKTSSRNYPPYSDDNNYGYGKGWAQKVKINLNANGYRLPTEAEWEFSCLGGNANGLEWAYSSRFYGPTLDHKEYWFGEKSKEELPDGTIDYVTHEVGLLQPNGINIYDILGLVKEYTNDFWTDDVGKFHNTLIDYTNDPKGVILNPFVNIDNHDTSYFMIRGLEYSHAADTCSFDIYADDPYYCGSHITDRDDITGFRIVRTIKE